ncbi:MAG TPA: methylated-DNA--[protein]-cysteine S-methyltransferase [Vicinamibacterales bacterium]|jgi:O-6-methylguanine DNA methyltransferase
MRLHRAVVSTPIGDMLAMSSPDGLCALEFLGKAKRLPRLERRLATWFPPHDVAEGDSPIIARTRAWLDRYFAGKSADVGSLTLDMRGADFERRVWKALLRIQPGETTSYGAIAKQLGSAGAARAVGLANGSNPIAIIVPCHRVIGSNGSLTGYGGGLDRKTWLIDHERRWRRDSLF